MSVTAEQLLKLPSLSRAKAAGGHGGLSRVASSVSVLESTDPGGLVDEVFPQGEFFGSKIVITGFLDSVDNVPLQPANIRRLADGGQHQRGGVPEPERRCPHDQGARPAVPHPHRGPRARQLHPGARHLSSPQNAIVVDVGGTATDFSVIQSGFPRESSVAATIGGGFAEQDSRKHLRDLKGRSWADQIPQVFFSAQKCLPEASGRHRHAPV